MPSTPKRTCSTRVIVGSSASRRLGYRRANHDHPWMVYAHEPMILAQSSSNADQAVGEAFHDLRLRDTHYCRTELTAPWGLQMEPCDIVTFHFFALGGCSLT